MVGAAVRSVWTGHRAWAWRHRLSVFQPKYRKSKAARPDFFGNATIIYAWKRLPEFSAVWAYTPKIAMYASSWSSPSTTQHSLPGGRYPLPGPDFHRLDRVSLLAHRISISMAGSIPGTTAKRSSTRGSFQTSRKTRAIGRRRSAGGSGCP